MIDRKYQDNFSRQYSDAAHNTGLRLRKAEKILAILADFYHDQLGHLQVLDIGCSTGVITHFLSKSLKSTIGIDIDSEAVEQARSSYVSDRLSFEVADVMQVRFPDRTFDLVLCNHIYEHVPDSRQMLREIHRVLRPGGVCFFAAGNRIRLMEPHYRLPFLSVLPKPLSHLYLRFLRKGSHYYENHLTYRQLQDLVKSFEIVDYTIRVIRDPEKFKATDMLGSGSIKQKIALTIARHAYWLCPNYIWLLVKR